MGGHPLCLHIDGGSPIHIPHIQVCPHTESCHSHLVPFIVPCVCVREYVSVRGGVWHGSLQNYYSVYHLYAI